MVDLARIITYCSYLVSFANLRLFNLPEYFSLKIKWIHLLIMEKWIIDTDAGVDDALALILALSSNIEVVAITTLSGNTCESNVYRNVCEILRVCNKTTPIFRGALRPIINQSKPCPEHHGDDGLGNYWLSHSDSYFPEESTERAASAIVRLSKEHPQLKIICLGPLTNLATAYLLEPTLTFGGGIEIMGGTIDAIGNTTALAEFNIYTDPEAAFIVFQRAPSLVITPWEACEEKLSLYQHIVDQFEDNEKANFVKKIAKVGTFYCDSIAMAAALDPSAISSFEERPILVELGGNFSRGHTIVCRDRDSAGEHLKRFKIIRAVDPDKFFRLLFNSLRS